MEYSANDTQHNRFQASYYSASIPLGESEPLPSHKPSLPLRPIHNVMNGMQCLRVSENRLPRPLHIKKPQSITLAPVEKPVLDSSTLGDLVSCAHAKNSALANDPCAGLRELTLQRQLWIRLQEKFSTPGVDMDRLAKERLVAPPSAAARSVQRRRTHHQHGYYQH